LFEIKTKLKEVLGEGSNADDLTDLFGKAYLKHPDLVSATQFLVNELFGQYGLVVVDGNSKRLKKSFIPYFEKDIFDNVPDKKVSGTIEKLKAMKYEAQVNPREINCFYMEIISGLLIQIKNSPGQNCSN
jgi:uncharacterized protein YllA (UPF0747 family)